MSVELIAVPYDSGQRGVRMGAGPLDLLEHGAAARAGAAEAALVEADPGWRAEVATAFQLAGRIADRVRAALERGRFPLVLAGNCASAVGTVAGLGPDGLGVLWLDAHADLNTPETSTSGFLDGMALSIVSGRCWRAAAAGVPGFRSLPEERIALVGARDLDPAEAEFLAASRIRRVTSGEAARDDEAIGAAVQAMAGAGARRLYLHLDLDVHDPSAGAANRFAAPGGLLPARTAGLIAAAAGILPLAGAAITAFDPAADPSGRARAAALDLIGAIAGLARG